MSTASIIRTGCRHLFWTMPDCSKREQYFHAVVHLLLSFNPAKHFLPADSFQQQCEIIVLGKQVDDLRSVARLGHNSKMIARIFIHNDT